MSAFCSSISAVHPWSGKRAMPMLARTAKRAAVDDERQRELLEHLARRQHGAVDVGRRQDQRELVAAEPGHRVGLAQRAAQARSHELQQTIAGMVADRVVDVLEPIEIQDEQRERVAVAVCGEHGLLQAIVEQRAIRQIGEGVVIGEMREALLRELPLTADAWSPAAPGRRPGSAA